MNQSAIQFSELADTATHVIAEAEARSVPVRVLGSAAVAILCQRAAISPSVVRTLWKDLDLVCTEDGYATARDIVMRLGFTPDAGVELATDGRRSLFRARERQSFHIDLFIDPIELCHRISLGKRLPGADTTLTSSDLLLTQIQRVHLQPTDRMDACLLMLVADAKPGRHVLEPGYIARVLSDDWGFWKTARDNLSSIMDAPSDIRGALVEDQWLGVNFKETVSATARRLIQAIDSTRKTLRWHLRSMIGSSIQWYRTVESPDVF